MVRNMLQRVVLLLVLTICSCSTATQYVVINKAKNRAGGKRFDQIIGSTRCQSMLVSASHFIQNALYVGAPPVPQKQVNKVTLYIDDVPLNGVVTITVGDGTNQSAIYLSQVYVGSYTGDLVTEVKGLLYHEMTHVWEWNGQGTADMGLMGGIGDYIRLTAGLAASTWGQPGQGQRWNEGYSVTAYFLKYCESLQAGFVRSLNAKLATGWDVSYFQDLLGQTVDQLWQSYKQKYDFSVHGGNAPSALAGNKLNGVPKLIGIIVGALGSALALCYIFVLFWRKKAKKILPFNVEEEKGLLELRSVENRPNLFTYNELKVATGAFHPQNKLGEGAFGAVFKGVLPDGTSIAVKQVSNYSKHKAQEFMNEIVTISAVQHRNLVKLLGCCVEGDWRLLVFELVENNSLSHALFGTGVMIELDWPTRYNICLGTARGLAYLHEESRVRIVHRDIKASNILLDKNLNAKIADFGLAKLFEEHESHISTRVAGTFGYMAPEYAMRGQLTEKADVFSFGVLTLELISGRRNMDNDLPTKKAFLLEWAWHLYENKRPLDLVDPKLIQKYDEKQAQRVVQVALFCTQAVPAMRPTMSHVVAMLTGHAEITGTLFRPGFLSEKIQSIATEAQRSYTYSEVEAR